MWEYWPYYGNATTIYTALIRIIFFTKKKETDVS